jgi:hypothetical protein
MNHGHTDRIHQRHLPLLALLTIVLSISGCMGQLACRHQALEDASWGIEHNLETRISVYKVNHPQWDAHAQAQVKIGGQWKWMTQWFGYVFVDDEPSQEPTGYILFYSIPGYLEILQKGTYETTTGAQSWP